MTRKAQRIVAQMAKLDPDDMRAVHREACRLAHPIYAKMYRASWEAGVAASRDKQVRGYDAWRPVQTAMWSRLHAATPT